MMKHLKPALTCFSVLALVFFGCKKEYSYEVPGGGGQSGSYQWSFSEGANSYKGPIDTAFVDTVGTLHTLNIMGHSTDKKDNISLQIFADTVKVGTYVTDKCSFDYLRGSTAMYISDLTAIGQFTVTITAMDSISITGTFSGTALDTGKVKKTITDGKFKVRFKSAGAPPIGNNCTPSALTYCDTTLGTPFYAFTSIYASNVLTKIVAADSSTSPATIDNTFPISIGSVKISVDAGGAQYFTTSSLGGGKVTGFVGYTDPTHNSTNPITVTYSYDAGGHLIDRVQTDKTTTPATTIETTYTYSGDLLTQAAVKYMGFKVAQVDYTYDPNKPVKDFLDLHPFAAELMLFQSAINAGVICNQALVKAVETDYNPLTTPATVTGVYTAYLTKYNIDANKHVKSFQVTGDDFVAGDLKGATLYKLTYHCQ